MRRGRVQVSRTLGLGGFQAPLKACVGYMPSISLTLNPSIGTQDSRPSGSSPDSVLTGWKSWFVHSTSRKHPD